MSELKTLIFKAEINAGMNKIAAPFIDKITIIT